jgi:hypothetical protein
VSATSPQQHNCSKTGDSGPSQSGKSGRVYAVAAIVTHPDAAKGTPALDALIEWVARES